MTFSTKPRLPLLCAVFACWTAFASGHVMAEQKPFAVVAPFEVEGLDPSVSGYVFQRMQITETLLDADANGEPLPGLAEKWEVSKDGKRWTFTLRQGVKFHDGADLTAVVAAHSLNVARSKTGILTNAKIENVMANGNDVIIDLATPFPLLPSLLAHYSTNILAAGSYDAEDAVQKIIGTGPFALTLLQPPQRLVTKRFDDYWGKKPTIEAASYLGAGRGETRALMAESGGAELVFQLDPPSIARLKRSTNMHVLLGSVPRVVILAVNSGKGATADKEVRQALSMAIQREGIAAAILRAPGTGATQMFSSDVKGWHDAALPNLAFNPQAARGLLKTQGWVAGADGMLQKDGKPLRFKLVTYADRPELPLIATALQAQFKEVGIDVEVSVTNASAVPASHKDGSLELALYSRNYALVPNPQVTLLADFGNGGNEWGPLGWDTTQFDKSMTALLSEKDPATAQRERNAIITQLQDELPLIPIAWYRQSIAVSNKVEGAAVDPFERTFGLSSMRWSQ
ncbi:ABC transporter substrate-binding protein [Pseudomonas asiatica]|uniref:ABC transporter substrate-binding protein n=1 Tax=Pseudomonas asiatica TaxID=2219225 RepID=UPI0025700329|nr:ABC transporter substrate-binding protein [Pseudomonas asiatica]WJD72237.1 ABC transporter substrate-binding protein [Pseudomonas asiatica]